tara:strand:+ start:52 stop:264 length:213 start_codon:yes stop_codon:yes gene_type:complete
VFTLYSINKYASPNRIGVKINIASKNSKIFFGVKKIWYIEIEIKKTIANITGIEDGLEVNNKNIMKISSK